MKHIFYLFVTALIIYSCNSDNAENIQQDQTSEAKDFSNEKIFELLEGNKTNIDFVNQITEDLEINTIANDGIIQGGGVAVLDVDNNGLMDVYFAGNQVTDKLYLNKGDFKFDDISEKAGIDKNEDWSAGVAIADVNGDGYDDIYVCKFLYDDKNRRKNVLYINNQDNTFTESAETYGLADDGYSVMANFFDFDRDGDLDVYVANQPPSNKQLKKSFKPTDYQYTDRLYENKGDNKFVDITNRAGIKNVCYTLSATTTDFNNDGWIDIYIASDYEEPDILYQNTGKGTFINITNKAIKHISNFSMGSDIADINNDGYMDIFTADMVAEDNFRNKTNMSSMAVEKFWALVSMGYHYQYMFNSLQLNNGNGTFSEIAQMSGISKTDWSWSSLFVDADQDGYKDLFVTNGILKEIRNKDYQNKLKDIVKKRKAEGGKNIKFDPLELANLAPSKKIANRVFRNNGDLYFDKKEDQWGWDKPGWSQGMAYADFDNDGDLDFVLNNTNEKPDIYRNLINDKEGNNYLTVKVKGTKYNQHGIGSRVIVEANGMTQLCDITPYRGYMSTCAPLAHFGIGQDDKVEKVTVIFPDGKVMTANNVEGNTDFVAEYKSSLSNYNFDVKKKTLFAQANDKPEIIYTDNPYNDYKKEVLIPYKMSNLGPFFTKADVNGDGNEDLFIGGAIGQPARLYIQNEKGNFTLSKQEYFEAEINYEDSGAAFFDVDGDNDLDLYVTSGGNEHPIGSENYQDRVYINRDGKFVRVDAIPKISESTSTVLPIDFDSDGDLDLFVGGRQIPGGYGNKANSYILHNTSDKFVNATDEIAPFLKNFGMVTSAAFEDIDGDGSKELLIAGEWMEIQVLKFENDKFSIVPNTSLANSSGLWNTMKTDDIDGDGDIDILAGNYGLNYKYTASEDAPYQLYVNDFDKNGTNDVYLGYVDEADGKLYPVRGRQCSSEQMPFVKEKYENYNEFGKATVIDVLDGKLEGTTIEEAKTLAHEVFINDGKGNFESKKLPMLTQVAPIYDMVITDINEDGQKDIISVGNFFNREVETTRSDAGIGNVLLGKGNGEFDVVHPSETGIIANKDARAIVKLKNKSNKSVYAIGNNGSEVQFFIESE